MNRMFSINGISENNTPVTNVSWAAKLKVSIIKLRQDTKEDVSFAMALHDKKRDELYLKRKAYLEQIK